MVPYQYIVIVGCGRLGSLLAGRLSGPGSSVLIAYGYSIRDSFFEFASALGTVGVSVGVTAPDAPAGVLWLETLAMFLGRLEFFTIVIGLGKLLADGPALFARSLVSRQNHT